MAFKTGFIGASTNDATEWVAAQVEDARKVFVPFAGTGKDIQSMCNQNTTIESWDTQRYSRYIIDGIFAASQPESNVDKLRYRKGTMYETRAIKNIDERCAGFFDWIAEHGTDFDKACIASATVRSTLIGRMTQWYANIEQYWNRFERARRENAQWIGQPGKFIHHEGSVFDNLPTGSYDLMQVDPPKVVVGSDVYSANFNSIQQGFGGEPLPKWNWRDVIQRFDELLQVDAKRIVFLYVSGVRPPWEEVRDLLEKYGVIEKEEAFDHRGRVDYGVVLKKGS